MLKRQTVLILCIAGFLVFSCVESNAEKQLEQPPAILFNEFSSMVGEVAPAKIKILEVERESEKVISIKGLSDDFNSISELLAGWFNVFERLTKRLTVIKATQAQGKIEFHIELILNDPKSIIGTHIASKFIGDMQGQIPTQKNQSGQKTQKPRHNAKSQVKTDTLTLRRPDGSTFKMEGQVNHYRDNKFGFQLGTGGKMSFALEQVGMIVFSEMGVFGDTLTLRKDDGSTNTFEGQVKCYEDNKFILASNSGEEISFPAERVQLIAFNVIAKKQIAGTIFRGSSEQIVQGEKTQTAGYLKVLISLGKHKIHEDELGQENCSGYHVYLSKTPLSIKSIESNARTKARKRDTGKKFKRLIEKQFYEWYFYEDLVGEFKKFPYHSTTDVKGVGVIRDLAPGIYCVGAYGRSSGRTYGVRHNVDFAWYHQVEVQDSETARLNLNFSNRKVTAIDRNWNLYGGK